MGVKLREVAIPPPGLRGAFVAPASGTRVLVFAHGSGGGRSSPRNRVVAEALRRDGLGTRLLDLLRLEEAEDRRRVFDIPLLAERLSQAGDWLPSPHGVGGAVPVGLAAAAPGRVRAVVSRGDRPGLTGPGVLGRVRAPTVLIVGSPAAEVHALNRTAATRLDGEAEVRVLQGAGHLFEEPGTLEAVVALAREWREWRVSRIGRERSQP